MMEVRGELRKVAWPTKHEVINSTIIVLIAVVVMTTLIFGFDYVSAKAVLFPLRLIENDCRTELPQPSRA